MSKIVQKNQPKILFLIQLPFTKNLRNQNECWGDQICGDNSLICDKIGGCYYLQRKIEEEEETGEKKRRSSSPCHNLNITNEFISSVISSLTMAYYFFFTVIFLVYIDIKFLLMYTKGHSETIFRRYFYIYLPIL